VEILGGKNFQKTQGGEDYFEITLRFQLGDFFRQEKATT
jgi:hypothetical protein